MNPGIQIEWTPITDADKTIKGSCDYWGRHWIIMVLVAGENQATFRSMHSERIGAKLTLTDTYKGIIRDNLFTDVIGCKNFLLGIQMAQFNFKKLGEKILPWYPETGTLAKHRIRLKKRQIIDATPPEPHLSRSFGRHQKYDFTKLTELGSLIALPTFNG